MDDRAAARRPIHMALRYYEDELVPPPEPRSMPAWAPERRLMLAILRDAIECFQRVPWSPRVDDEPDFRAAERWLFQRDQSWVFSFESICDALAIDAHRIRKALRNWQTRSPAAARQMPHTATRPGSVSTQAPMPSPSRALAARRTS